MASQERPFSLHFGTGSISSERTDLQPYRHTSGHFLATPMHDVLIEAGDGALDRLQASMGGYDPSRLGFIVASHDHPDHAGGLTSTIQKAWGIARNHPGTLDHLTIIGNSRLKDKFYMSWANHNSDAIEDDKEWKDLTLAQLVEQGEELYDRIAGDDLRLTFLPLCDSNVLELPDGTTISSRRVKHNHMNAHALRFEMPDGFTIAYSGDTGYVDLEGAPASPPLVEMARNADLFIGEAGLSIDDDNGDYDRVHLSPKKLGRIAAAAHPRLLLVTHLPNKDSDADIMRQIKMGGFEGPIQILRDNDTFALKH